MCELRRFVYLRWKRNKYRPRCSCLLVLEMPLSEHSNLPLFFLPQSCDRSRACHSHFSIQYHAAESSAHKLHLHWNLGRSVVSFTAQTRAQSLSVKCFPSWTSLLIPNILSKSGMSVRFQRCAPQVILSASYGPRHRPDCAVARNSGVVIVHLDLHVIQEVWGKLYLCRRSCSLFSTED